MNISKEAQNAILKAWTFALSENHEFVTPEHLLLVLLQHPITQKLLILCGTDLDFLKDGLTEYLKKNIPISPNQQPIQTVGFENVVQQAYFHCLSAEKKGIFLADLLVSIYDARQNICASLLRQAGVNRLNLLGFIVNPESENDLESDFVPLEESVTFEELLDEYLKEENLVKGKKNKEKNSDWLNFGEQLFENSKFSESDLIEENSSNSNDFGQKEKNEYLKDLDDANGVFRREKESGKTKRSMTERLTVDLTAKAANGELDNLIGRKDEMQRTLQILCRRSKNNPLFVGEPGVGKTAMAEGLAQVIASEAVPEPLKGFKVLSLDIGVLIAGTKFRGEFEDRIKKLSDELIKKGNIILFIDEIHTIVGAGTAGNAALDAANLFKPLFSSKNVRCLGCTTYAEYNKIFEKDRALSRRFQKIDIAEHSENETLQILNGLKNRYEEYHSVRYSQKALQKAVKLTSQFILERRLPDKAVDLIDEAGSYARLHKNEFNFIEEEILAKTENTEKISKKYAQIEENLIEKICAKMANIPEQTVSTNEKEILRNLENNLKLQVFSQNLAVENVVKAVKRSRAGFTSGEKPVACFLFAGPTGVGKTELAKSLAKILNLKLHRFDMSEYQEKHTVSRLIGSPPGYVGFEEGGLLTDAVRKEPNAVVLLDEIEKAHSDIFNILLQVMDYATLTDNQGRKADFRNVILIMTSNAGAREITKSPIGFAQSPKSHTAVTEAVEKLFTPEFINRLDAVIPFNHLDLSVMKSICQKEISQLNVRLKEKGVEVVLTDECLEFIANEGFSAEYGARNISRAIDQKISTPLVDEVLFGSLCNGGKTICNVVNGEIEIKYQKRRKQKQEC